MCRKVERCEYKLSKIKTKELRELRVKLDDVEQKFYEKDVQLVGVPELPENECNEEEEIKTIVKLAKEKMSITIKEGSIEKLHRLGKRKTNKHRDVVVRFRSSTTRNKFYQNRQKIANHSDPEHSIFVNDHLTEYRRNVFYAVRQLVKKKEVFAGWSQQGNILIRRNEGDSPVHVQCHEQLAEMKLAEKLTDDEEYSEDDDDAYDDNDFD